MAAPVIDLAQYKAPASIGGIAIPKTAAPVPYTAPSPLARLDLTSRGGLSYSSPLSSNLLPPELGGPATNAPVIQPIVPTAVAAPAPIKTVNSSLTTPIQPAPAIPTANPQTAQDTLGSALAAFGTGLQGLSDSLGKQGTDAGAGGGTAAPAAPAEGGTLADTLKQLLTLNDKLDTKGAATNEANAEQDVAGKAQRAQDLTNEYNSRSRYYDDRIKSVQSKNTQGKSADAIQQEVDQLTRQKNSELADIAIQQSAAAGNLTVAQSLAQAKVDAEFEPIQAKIDNLKTYYSLAANDMTESEKEDAQAAIQEKQSAADEEKQKRLTLYRAQIDQEYGGGSSGGTLEERQANAISTLQSTLDTNTPLANGNLPVDTNGYLTPEAWKTLIALAPSEGLDRASFIKAFGGYVYNDANGGIPATYGITPAEQKLIIGS